MNEKKKTKICGVFNCNNKSYKKNKLTPIAYEWVCRKHYYMYSYGYSEKEASYK